jgi:diaminopropionate ammonia-lyase
MMPSCNLHVNARQSGASEYETGSFSPRAVLEAVEEIRSWPSYKPTPLHDLRGLARAAGVGKLWYKDEAHRFGLGSFKVLGGSYGVFRVLQERVAEQTGERVTSHDLRGQRYSSITNKITIAAATDGNHGRAVAWAANAFHCSCIIYLPAACSAFREQAIRRYSADTVRTEKDYSETVRQCSRDAETNGWQVVSDTSWEGYERVPHSIMQGYTVMASEIISQLHEDVPTHIFVQGGVGALAAALCGFFRQCWEKNVPRLVVVEPEGAACLYVSAVAGKPTPVSGTVDTIMAGLACREASPLAWRILETAADYFITIPDSTARTCMRLLASSPYGDVPIVAGESAVAGLAGLLCAVSREKTRGQLGLDQNSRVIVFGTEGDTDPFLYQELVGQSSSEVRQFGSELV